MSAPRGRPLKERSADDRLAFLDRLLGSDRARKNVVVRWEAHRVQIWTHDQTTDEPPLGEGLDLGRALDQAISRSARGFR